MFRCIWIALVTTMVSLSAAEWQWSVPIAQAISRGDEESRAFLWIPTDCKQVRGVMFGHHNMQEEGLLEHPAFRKAMTDLGFAAVWVAPTFDPYFRYDQDAGQRFDAMMKELADQSGYSELTAAPLVVIGHSAAASMPWYAAAWKPERIIAGISMSGQWPYVPDEKNAPQAAGANIDSVPGIVTIGEYEWADPRMDDGLKVRVGHPAMPLSAIGCPADGHFDLTDEKAVFFALYLKKAVEFRLPKTGSLPVRLNPVDPTRSGWLVDRYRFGKDPVAPAAPVAEYTGNRAEAFWFFDGELAKAAEDFQTLHRGNPALLGFVQNGATVPQKNGTHQQVTLPFKPGDDGITFKLSCTFLDTVPEGRPEKWSGKKAGDPIQPPPAGGPPIRIERITGPIRRVSDDTWELAFNRTSFLGDRRGNEGWLAAVWPGGSGFKRAIQQAMLAVPRRNNDGAEQSIHFDPTESVPYGTRGMKLAATSSSGLPVRFLVREGPAEVTGDTLNFLPLPPRTRFPVTVTVVAWQFGRSAAPAIQTAEPVIRCIKINR